MCLLIGVGGGCVCGLSLLVWCEGEGVEIWSRMEALRVALDLAARSTCKTSTGGMKEVDSEVVAVAARRGTCTDGVRGVWCVVW